MKVRVFVFFGILAASSLPVFAQAAARSPNAKQAADEVIALTRAHWAAEMRKDAAAWGKNVADDYTVFEGAYPTRIDGKATMQHVVDGNFSGSDTLITAEMANEKVQVYGDTAILSATTTSPRSGTRTARSRRRWRSRRASTSGRAASGCWSTPTSPRSRRPTRAVASRRGESPE